MSKYRQWHAENPIKKFVKKKRKRWSKWWKEMDKLIQGQKMFFLELKFKCPYLFLGDAHSNIYRLSIRSVIYFQMVQGRNPFMSTKRVGAKVKVLIKGLCMFIVWFIILSIFLNSRALKKKQNTFFFFNGESQSTNVTEKNQYREEQKITQEKGCRKRETGWDLMETLNSHVHQWKNWSPKTVWNTVIHYRIIC